VKYTGAPDSSLQHSDGAAAGFGNCGLQMQ